MTPLRHLVLEHVGQALGAISLLAGASVWGVVGGMYDWWRIRNTPLSEWNPVDQSPQYLSTVLIFLAARVALHLGHWVLRRWFDRRQEVLGLSTSGWRWLFIGCYATGFTGGGLLFVAVVRSEH